MDITINSPDVRPDRIVASNMYRKIKNKTKKTTKKKMFDVCGETLKTKREKQRKE